MSPETEHIMELRYQQVELLRLCLSLLSQQLDEFLPAQSGIPD